MDRIKKHKGQRYYLAGFDDRFGIGISINADNITIKKARKLHQVLGEIIKYLENKP